MKPRRRTILKMLLLLIAGATLNVAVAWGLAVWLDPSANIVTPTTKGFSSQYGPCWGYSEWRLPGAARLMALERTNYWSEASKTPPYVSDPQDAKVPLWSLLGEVEARDPFGSYERMRIEDARGWPVYSMASAYEPFDAFTKTLTVESGISISPYSRPFYFPSGAGLGYFARLSEPRNIPLRPILPGFAINTLFYAGVLWVLFAIPFALRRMIRRRRGQCPACAYPIGQSPVCTECGAAVNVTESRP